MKTLSIKSFSVMVLFLVIILESIVFYNYYIATKETTEKLLKTNIQTDILNLYHFLNKNFKPESVNDIASHIDNVITINKAILDIHITDTKNNIIYHPNMRFDEIHPADKHCLPIANIMHSDILKDSCFIFKLKYYKTLTPQYYAVKIYLDKKYISDLLLNEIKKIVLLFLLATFLLIAFTYIVGIKFIIKPLEQLRRYAYYSEYPPEQFRIRELESIRYSLGITFTRLKKEQENLYKLSTKDPLSGLYNRLSLIDKINWFISKAQRDHSQFALIFLDLDNFKNINDSKGHDFGDKVLQHISKILLQTVRSNDIVSRLGGDEFVIVLPDFENEGKIIDVTQRIKNILSIPSEIDNYKYSVTASMGITIYPKDGKDVNSLLKNADIAMYKSKDLGKNKYHFFTDSLNKSVQEKIAMQRLLVQALENNYFQLFYQPKVDIKTNKIVACEALIRLVDPIEGIIPPDKFIPVAEENGFIIKLGDWIVKEACRQLIQWEQTRLKDIKISINVSGVQLNELFLIKLHNEVIETNIDINKLDIELTESVFIDHFDEKMKIINTIKKMGITLSLDDFGTGYSSLSYLKNIPFSTLKIDKAFIDDFDTQQGEKFINMIVGIANDLKMIVVAEGVETPQQLAYLKSINCEMYQGYLCSKPLPAHQFEELYNTHRSS